MYLKRSIGYPNTNELMVATSILAFQLIMIEKVKAMAIINSSSMAARSDLSPGFRMVLRSPVNLLLRQGLNRSI